MGEMAIGVPISLTAGCRMRGWMVQESLARLRLRCGGPGLGGLGWC